MHTLSAEQLNSTKIITGDFHFDQNPYTWQFQDRDECHFDRIAKEYAQKGELVPPLLLVCRCKKCTPQC